MGEKIAAIILAGGKGRRMQAGSVNKVTLLLADKPIILRNVHLLGKTGFSPIIIVVGHAKESVITVLKDTSVVFAEQKEQLGTADAARAGLAKLSLSTNVLVVNGDDWAHYTSDLLKQLVKKHITQNASVTFLTTVLADATGLGRIVRDKNGNVTAIVEEKDAREDQKNIKEINVGCYIFRVDFLKEYLPEITRNETTKEYYLVDLIKIAAMHKEKIQTVLVDKLNWQGVNTKEELEKAEQLLSRI